MPPRFYLNQALTTGQAFELPTDAKHHATRVLRLKTNDKVTLFNGLGGEYVGHIINTNKSNTNIFIEQFYDINRESPLKIELAQAICANEKMDWIIQKAVELGVTHIQPISTNRSIVRLSTERAAKRLQHWEKTIISACEQCGRNQLTAILPMSTLPNWLSKKKINNGPKHRYLMLSPTAEKTLNHLTKPTIDTNITILIGPEGGFTTDEEVNILHSDFTPLRLGQRILRTETAALATITAMQTLWGDF